MSVMRVPGSQTSGHVKSAGSVDSAFLGSIQSMNRISKEKRNGQSLSQPGKCEQRPSSWKASKVPVPKPESGSQWSDRISFIFHKVHTSRRVVNGFRNNETGVCKTSWGIFFPTGFWVRNYWYLVTMEITTYPEIQNQALGFFIPNPKISVIL